MRGTKGQLVTVLMLVALLSATTFWLAGCKKKAQPAAQGTTQEEVSESNEAIAQTTCPVMGGAINKDIYTEYKGKKVYFCCPSCKEKFEQDPGKYISKLPQFSK